MSPVIEVSNAHGGPVVAPWATLGFNCLGSNSTDLLRRLGWFPLEFHSRPFSPSHPCSPSLSFSLGSLTLPS